MIFVESTTKLTSPTHVYCYRCFLAELGHLSWMSDGNLLDVDTPDGLLTARAAPPGVACEICGGTV